MGENVGDDDESPLPAIFAQLLLFVLLTGMAGSVDTDRLRLTFRRKWLGILLGASCQFVLLPAMGFAAAKAFDLDAAFGIALIITTASPGGAYSNWWCSLLNADLALSIAMTTCSTLASAFAMPANIAAYTQLGYSSSPTFQWLRLLLSIAVAIGGIVTGTLLSAYLPSKRRLFNVIGNIAGLCLIGLGLFVSTDNDPLWEMEPVFYPAVAAPCILGLVLSLSMAMAIPWLSAPEAVAVAVETVYQNTGLALSITLSIFEGDERGRAAGVPVFYSGVQIVLLPLLLLTSWKLGYTHAPPSVSICAAVTKDFQPRSDDSDAMVPGDDSPGKSGETFVPVPVDPARIGAQDSEH